MTVQHQCHQRHKHRTNIPEIIVDPRYSGRHSYLKFRRKGHPLQTDKQLFSIVQRHIQSDNTNEINGFTVTLWLQQIC